MTERAELAESLVPVAAELVGTVRDYGADTVAEVLGRVPEGRFDALAVVLAAMVDPDKTPKQLLRWMHEPIKSRAFEPREGGRKAGRPPEPREHGTEKGYQQHRNRRDKPACAPCLAAHSERTKKGPK